ncbi:lysophospholipid acyltransferase family protein [Candidatus Pelagibacter sp. Uisw_113]|uniref:lysophospholipid acyltransferase family protein n=1 Tax=Candidatus Pelagibacter sp. Uisw_113 TaxID=3230994 RepID=UPI0039E84186
MKLIKYFIQFLIISIFFILFKVLGLRMASNFSKIIFSLLGPFFRSKQTINKNILKALPNLSNSEINKISRTMWGNYGRILSEYMFLSEFRFRNNIEIKGQQILDELKESNEQVIFVSGHFNNFELMAMQIEKSGINLAAIYRPLNNKFLNYFMEKIRKKYICKNQIKKGSSGTRQLLSLFKKGSSIALMIDQRVSEGILSKFFKNEALTTTIPAQFVKKFRCKVVPIYIERIKDIDFRLTVHAPINFSEDETIDTITLKLNSLLERMILQNPGQWIWSHNRWK